MPRALILGGGGVLGRAIARRMLEADWQVDITGRDAAHQPPELAALGGGYLVSDRTRRLDLERAIGDGADLLVDCRSFTADDAHLLVPYLGALGSTVMLSSKAVYVDEQGRHGNSLEQPEFDAPIRETQPTVPPGRGEPDTREGYGRNKVAAENVLLDAGEAVTVLRIGKVHGVGAARPREWVFVKRVLDDRPALFVRAASDVDQTSAAVNVAALVETVARVPGHRILNAGDPDAPSAAAIGRAVAARMGHDWDEVRLPADSDLGVTPWSTPRPVVLDMTAATALGYEPVGEFAETVAAELDWLLDLAERGEGPTDPWFDRFLEYAPEDAYLLRRQLGL